MTLRDTADQIIRASLRAVQPDAAVQRALQEFSCAGRVVLIAIGKAAQHAHHLRRGHHQIRP